MCLRDVNIHFFMPGVNEHSLVEELGTAFDTITLEKFIENRNVHKYVYECTILMALC